MLLQQIIGVPSKEAPASLANLWQRGRFACLAQLFVVANKLSNINTFVDANYEAPRQNGTGTPRSRESSQRRAGLALGPAASASVSVLGHQSGLSPDSDAGNSQAVCQQRGMVVNGKPFVVSHSRAAVWEVA